jgi:hypothetical protein
MRSSTTSDTRCQKREPGLSLEEMFSKDAERLKRWIVDNIGLGPEVAWCSLNDVERLKLTRDRAHSMISARDATVRQNFFSEYGLTQETLESAPEALQSELLSRLSDSMHSTDAKLESGLYWAAVAREKRLQVKAKAEAILSTQRERSKRFTVPKKLVADVFQRSTFLYCSELKEHFTEKYIEEVEKSDAYLTITKAALKARGDLLLPDLYEVGKLMSNELLHPDAFGQILAERHAAKQARGKYRRERMRKFFSFASWLGALPLFVRKLIAPVEVKSILSALGEEARLLKDGPPLGPALGIEIITPRVVEDVLSWCKEIRGDVRSGKTPRATALYLMMNVARDYLASGMFHIYRGQLSMQGTALKSINMYCLDELTKLGLTTAEERSAALKATSEDIRAVG